MKTIFKSVELNIINIRLTSRDNKIAIHLEENFVGLIRIIIIIHQSSNWAFCSSSINEVECLIVQLTVISSIPAAPSSSEYALEHNFATGFSSLAVSE